MSIACICRNVSDKLILHRISPAVYPGELLSFLCCKIHLCTIEYLYDRNVSEFDFFFCYDGKFEWCTISSMLSKCWLRFSQYEVLLNSVEMYLSVNDTLHCMGMKGMRSLLCLVYGWSTSLICHMNKNVKVTKMRISTRFPNVLKKIYKIWSILTSSRPIKSHDVTMSAIWYRTCWTSSRRGGRSWRGSARSSRRPCGRAATTRCPSSPACACSPSTPTTGDSEHTG